MGILCGILCRLSMPEEGRSALVVALNSSQNLALRCGVGGTLKHVRVSMHGGVLRGGVSTGGCHGR